MSMKKRPDTYNRLPHTLGDGVYAKLVKYAQAVLNRPELKKNPLTPEELEYWQPKSPGDEAREKGVTLPAPSTEWVDEEADEQILEQHDIDLQKQQDQPPEQVISDEWSNDISDASMFALQNGIDDDVVEWVLRTSGLGFKYDSKSDLDAVASKVYDGTLSRAILSLDEAQAKLVSDYAKGSVPQNSDIKEPPINTDGISEEDVAYLMSFDDVYLPNGVMDEDTHALLDMVAAGGIQPQSSIATHIRRLPIKSLRDLDKYISGQVKQDVANEFSDETLLVRRMVPGISYSPARKEYVERKLPVEVVVPIDAVQDDDIVVKEYADRMDRLGLVDVYTVKVESVPSVDDRGNPAQEQVVTTVERRIPKDEVGPNDYIKGVDEVPSNEQLLENASKTRKDKRVEVKPQKPPAQKPPPKPQPSSPSPEDIAADDAAEADLDALLSSIGQGAEAQDGISAPQAEPEVNPRQELIDAVKPKPAFSRDMSSARFKSKIIDEFVNDYEIRAAGLPEDVKVAGWKDVVPVKVYSKDRRNIPDEVPDTPIYGGQLVVSYADNMKEAMVVGSTPDGKLAVRVLPDGRYEEWDVKDKEARWSLSTRTKRVEY